MGLTLLIIFMFVAFFLTTLFRKWLDIPTLIAVAIGCAVNANIFNPITAPIPVGPFTFSVEVILYTLYMYTIMVRILDYSYYEGKRMTFTSIAAIIISALIETVSKLATANSFDTVIFKDLAGYLFSCLGTIVGVWIMVLLTIHLRKANVNSLIIIMISIALSSMIHSVIYYGGLALIHQDVGIYTWNCVYGTLLGKAVCILLAMFCYFVNQKWWKPNIKKQEQNKEK